MKNGVLRDDEGYDLLIDDRKDVAIERAYYGKQGKYKRQLCQVRVRATGEVWTVTDDGRLA